jgi:D-alanine-D-alanine ligase
MARVDLFLKPSGEVVLNEINTIPGLTRLSPYGKMWEVSGLRFTSVVDKLIEYALDRFNKENELVREIEVKEIFNV